MILQHLNIRLSNQSILYIFLSFPWLLSNSTFRLSSHFLSLHIQQQMWYWTALGNLEAVSKASLMSTNLLHFSTVFPTI